MGQGSAFKLKPGAWLVEGGGMTQEAEVLCFQCGQRLGDPPLEIPELADGSPCPACTARLLDLLPPLLPRRNPAAAAPAYPSDQDLGEALE